MKEITLSDDAIELLLVLLEFNIDFLSRTFQDNFSPELVGAAGRVPNQSDIGRPRN
jgi:hypothetical protein